LIVANSVCDRDSSTEGSLDEAKKCFVNFNQMSLPRKLSGLSLLGQAKRYKKKLLQSHNNLAYPKKNHLTLLIIKINNAPNN